MRNLLLLLSTILLATTAQAAPEMSIYEAINKAGYQRMLTQRVAKCYLSIVAGLDGERQKTHLMGSAKAFENNLRELKNFAPTEQIGDQFRYIKILWDNYKFINTNNYTKANAEVILQFNNKILKACHEAVLMLENYALENQAYGNQEVKAGDQDLASIINAAGRQRMLTQRMALYAIAKAYNIGNAEENLRLYSAAVNDFTKAYKRLMACSKNTPQIDEEYINVSNYWNFLETGFTEILDTPELNDSTKEKALEVLEKIDLLLFRFDEIVFLYERQKN